MRGLTEHAVPAVRLTQKWIEGEYWAQQFATRSLVAFAHVKGGPTAHRIAMSDALRKKGVAFKIAKHGALRRGLEDTPWKLAAYVRNSLLVCPCWPGCLNVRL